MYLYLEVTPDEYQLPLAVAESRKELAVMRGITSKQIKDYLAKTRAGKIKNPRFIRIEVDSCD